MEKKKTKLKIELICDPAVSLLHIDPEVKVAQSCLTLGNPKDYTVHGILQATLE